MYVDTHCHLTMFGKEIDKESGKENNYEEISKVIKEARDVDVNSILTIATTLQDTLESIKLAKKFDGVYASAGIHPCDCSQVWQDDFKKIKLLVEKKEENKIVGIGETGLDFYHKPFDKQRQVDAFKAHIECSIENNLPLIIHIRESAEEVLKTLDPYKKDICGVAHSFFQTKDIAKILLDWGFYLGIGGPLSYKKNDWLRELYIDIPLDRIVLETDAPFLPPQEYRGKKNYPKYIPLIAKVLAEIKQVDVSVVGDVTSENVKRLFGV